MVSLWLYYANVKKEDRELLNIHRVTWSHLANSNCVRFGLVILPHHLESHSAGILDLKQKIDLLGG